MINGDSLGYYAALEVTPDVGAETIKQQYHELAKIWHPDRNTGDEAAEKFQKISVAYMVLKDEKTRLQYDLLSQAYDADHFPDMNNLKIYTNRVGNEEVDLRHIKLTTVVGLLTKHKETTHTEICNYKEARYLAFTTALKNWLFGWWGVTAIPANLKAISNNYNKILSDSKGCFTLLTHNMLAYAQEKKYDEAYASGRLALRYADAGQKGLIQQFMETIPYQRDYIYPQWKTAGLKMVQLVVPVVILLALGLSGSTKIMTSEEFKQLWMTRTNINYFQEVQFQNGTKTVDDVAVAKVVSIPVDTEDVSNIYHVTKDSRVMYGPDNKFDVLAEIPAHTTVRLTGYTPDEQWVRIMIDNGEMGFVPKPDISRGKGKEIPENSKIYTGEGF